MTADTPDQLFVEFQSALVGRYSLERELGRGGMGVVYLAREVRLDRLVAIKLLPPTETRDAGLRERFLREARTAAKLSHPHIIPIFAVDEVGTFVFFAMAHVQGETLGERVRRRGPLTSGEAGRILREIAWALAYAHSQGVVHRDVKPDNIMLEEATGRALIADFGIAAEVRRAAGSAGGEVVGTPEFMSPEQALGEQIDGRSDLYALGAVGYFALSGKLLFEGNKATEVLAKQVTEPAPPLTSVAAVPRRLAQAIDRCLAKNPGDRPQTGELLAEQLGVAIEQQRELPVGLRVFVRRNARLGGVGGLLYVCSIPIALGVVGEFLGRAAAEWTLFGSLVVVPFGVLVGRARSFLVSGFGPEELGVAFRAEFERGREERRFEFGRGPSLQERVLRLLSVVCLAVAAGSGLILLNATYPTLTFKTFQWLLLTLRWSGAVGAVSGFLAVAQLQRRVDLDTRIWAWVWLGPLGRLLFRIARRSIPAKTLPPSVTHRATEIALAMAVDQLFEELPRESRSRLRDLPDVVHRLEGDAQRMRRRFEELQDALAGAGTGLGAPGDKEDSIAADLEREREVVQRRLSDAVRALETLRLNLLKLHAGSGSLEHLTTDLGLALELAEDIGRHIAAREEVDDALS